MKAYLSELLTINALTHRSVVRPISVVLAIGSVLTIVAAWMVRSNETDESQLRFQGIGDAVASSIVEVMEADENVLWGGVALLGVVETMNLAKWTAYGRKLRLRQHFPGIQGVGFAPVVDPNGIEAFEARMRADGRPDFTYHPRNGTRDLTTSIAYLDPPDERNRRALGYDMYSEPTRRAAMERARDTGKAALTAPLRLVQEDGRDEQPGVLMYLPVYRTSTEPQTVEQRRAALAGFVFSPLRTRDLIGKTLTQLREYESSLIRVRLYDASQPDSEVLLFDSQPANSAPLSASAHTYTRHLMINGVPWTIRMASTSTFDTKYRTLLPLLVAAIGFLITGLSAIFVGLLVAGRDRARTTVRQLGQEMAIRQRAEEQARVAVHELTHRVKNTLSIVAAIASQTIRHSDTLSDFDKSFRTRLLGLGRVHDLLASGRTYSTELVALCNEVLKPYKSNSPGALKLDGPPVALAPNTAVLLSMLLNELATNATKYGAWLSDNGTVDLTWRLDRDDDRPILHLSWAEAGGPQVAPVKRTGFGSNVMKFAIERSLGGTAQADFAPSGVRYDFTIPWGDQDQANHRSVSERSVDD